MSRHYVIFYSDDFNVKEWEDIDPDEVHFVKFKGKRYDEVRYGKWEWDGEYVCSVCGYREPHRKPPFCGGCGAKMDGDIE